MPLAPHVSESRHSYKEASHSLSAPVKSLPASMTFVPEFTFNTPQIAPSSGLSYSRVDRSAIATLNLPSLRRPPALAHD